jgi:PAS domain S-box-containing protein
MCSQPIQSIQKLLGRFLDSTLAQFPVAGLGAGFAFFPIPLGSFATFPLSTDSILIVALACLGGVLGLSTALLYRHMHAQEEKMSLRVRTAEAELRAVLALTNDAVLVLNADGSIRDGNPATEEFFNVSADDLPGSPLTDLIAQPLCLGELTKHGPVSFQTAAKRPGGEFPEVEIVLSSIEVAGKCTYLALVRDPLQAGNAEDAPENNLETQVKKFTHDLNNELTTVIGNLSLLLMSPPSDPANHQRILGAKRTAVRTQGLIHQLQAIASGDSPEPEAPAQQPAPAAAAAPAQESTPPSPAQVSAAEVPEESRVPRILVLDDEEAICSLVSMALDSMGFDVTEALSVAPALQACEDAVREGRPYDLVISDLSLPGEIDGIDAVNRLRSIHPKIQAIVSTGYSSHPIMGDCKRHGFAAAIAKPYDLGKLSRVVREVLGSGSASLFKTA